MSQLAKTKHQADFKDFKRFGAFKALVEQKNFLFNSFVCKLGSLLKLELMPKKAQFTHELNK
jgi:hypothetical protein